MRCAWARPVRRAHSPSRTRSRNFGTYRLPAGRPVMRVPASSSRFRRGKRQRRTTLLDAARPSRASQSQLAQRSDADRPGGRDPSWTVSPAQVAEQDRPRVRRGCAQQNPRHAASWSPIAWQAIPATEAPDPNTVSHLTTQRSNAPARSYDVNLLSLTDTFPQVWKSLLYPAQRHQCHRRPRQRQSRDAPGEPPVCRPDTARRDRELIPGGGVPPAIDCWRAAEPIDNCAYFTSSDA